MRTLKGTLILSSVLLASIVLILPFSTQAAIYSGGFSSGVLTYGNGINSTPSIASTASSQWNGVSSNASLTYSSATNQYGSTAKVVTYFNSTTAPTSGDYGKLYPYKAYTGTSATLATEYETWVKAVVYQYINPALDTIGKRTHIATHELGHALSVAHPGTTSIPSVMQSNPINTYNLQYYDKNNLQIKWGD